MTSLNYNDILRWMTDSCYELNLEYDLVSVADDTDRYPLLLVPALYSATDKTIARLNAYVEAGGHLLLGFHSCMADEELGIFHEPLPCRLTECIGATYDQFTEPEDVKVSFEGTLYEASEWMELVRPQDCEVWAYYQHPYWGQYAAITHRRHTAGEGADGGSATYLGCYMEKEGMKALVRKLAALAGISLSKNSFPVITKTGTNAQGNTITYYFNYSSVPQTACHEGSEAKELIHGHTICPGDAIQLPPWDLAILAHFMPPKK